MVYYNEKNIYLQLFEEKQTNVADFLKFLFSFNVGENAVILPYIQQEGDIIKNIVMIDVEIN